MGWEYCIFDGKRYFAHFREEKMFVTSKVMRAGFSDYISSFGMKAPGMYMRFLTEDEVEIIYGEEVLIRYRGEYFKLLNILVRKRDVREDSFLLYLESYEKAREYKFDQLEPFVFSKEIKRSEIEAIKVIQTPIKKFSHLAPTETILEGAAIDEWLANLLS